MNLFLQARAHERFARSLVAAAVMSAFSFATTVAQGQESKRSEPDLLALNAPVMNEVVVTASRSSRTSDVIPGTVTKINREDIERRQAQSIADVLADEPDISLPNDVRRFGAGAINIRGIEDNRVLLLIDGVRATDLRSAGTTNYDAANRDLPDPDFLKSVEVVRGPASSLYGADAIGGVVGFITLDPEDYLKDGKTTAYGAKATYASANSGMKETAWAAMGGDTVKGLVMASRLDAKQTETQGSNNVFGFTRTAANPQDISSNNLLAKFVVDPAVGHQFRFALEWKEKQTDTDVQRISNLSPSTPTALTRVTQNTGTDKLDRTRVSVDYIHKPTDAWYDRLTAKAYWQKQVTSDTNFQRRSDASLNATWGCSAQTAGSGNCNVNQKFDFEQSHLGTSVVLEKSINDAQFLTWGADLLRTQTKEVKNTTWTNLATGATSNQFLGESFPKSEYPKGHSDQFGLFGQDEFVLLEGRLRLTPGLRYDYFKLTPESDGLYKPVAGAVAVGKSGNRISPKLAASFELTPTVQAYAQYVEGFKAPNYEQVNRYFLNNQQNYGTVGNADLKPETSKGIELGFKLGNQNLGGQVAVYKNRYNDFIDSVRLASGDPANLPSPYTATYQYRNLSNVSINGFELRGHWQASSALKLSASYAYAWGQYESATAKGTFIPLNSVDPRRLSLSAIWSPHADWGVETRVRAAERKTRVDDTSMTLYRPAGYAVADVSTWWKLSRTTRVNLALNNMFDQKYVMWSDARKASLPIGDPGVDFYSMPGRNITASVQVDF